MTAAFIELRRVRQRRHLANIDWFDAFYRAYVTALLTAAAFVVLASLVGGHHIPPVQLRRVDVDGPAVVGLFAAAIAASGLRSGARGGPLSLEAAEVRIVLLAPIDRAAVLRRRAFRQLRTVCFGAAGTGAAFGLLAAHRLPGAAAGWIVGGALAVVTTAVARFGLALCAGGLRLGHAAATALGSALIVWSLVDLRASRVTSPFSRVGQLALWPRAGSPGAALGVAIAVAAVLAGLAVVARSSLEGLERRASLVTQLRFAVTTRDLRAVVLLRRQLADERPRARAWWSVGAGRRRPTAVAHRDAQGILRWPAARVVRTVALSCGAGLAIAGYWDGTRALLAGAAVLLWLVALDATEAVAQDVDHPDLTAGLPVPADALIARHLPVSIGVVLVSASVGVVPLAALAGGRAAGAAAASLASVALAASVGGVVATVVEQPQPSLMWLATPEAAGMRLVAAAVRAPLIAGIGLVPVVLAREVPLAAGATVGIAVLLAGAIAATTLFWLRVRSPLRALVAAWSEATLGRFPRLFR